MAEPSRLGVQLTLNGQDLKVEDGRLSFLGFWQTVRGIGQYSIVCSDKAWSYYDGLKEDDAEMGLRWGYMEDGEEVWSEEQKLGVTDFQLLLHPDRVQATITGLDKAFVLNERHSGKIFTDKLVSEMVQELADDAGLDTDIETTKEKCSLFQGRLSDAAFIQSVLLPSAFSSSRSDYMCFTRNGGTLVFRPPDLSSVQLTMKFPEGSDEYMPTEPLRLRHRRIGLAPMYALSVQGRTNETLVKEAHFFTADDDSSGYKKLESTGLTPPDVPGLIMTVADAGEELLDDWTKSAWCRRCREVWFVDAPAKLSPKLELGKAVRLEVTGPDGESHFASGKYLLGGLVHWIDAVNAESGTRLWLMRRTT